MRRSVILLVLLIASSVVACPLCERDKDAINDLSQEDMAIVKEYVEIYGYDVLLKNLLEFRIKSLEEKLALITITEIVVILDRSGSMENIKDDMVGGLKQFVADQKEVKGRANFTLVQFDTEYEVIYDGVDIQDVNEIDLVPRGWTALLDAIGRTIENAAKRIAKTPDRKVVFVIITDGLENSSQKFSKAEIVESIGHVSEKHSWKFIYLGANQDAIQEGTSLGIYSIDCTTFDTTSVGVLTTLRSASMTVTNFRDPNEYF